ncbi:MAG: Membrane protein insertase YidC [Fibrobacteres bacterium]|nr:Membrane protein insertase YidC [Fibrobacterota bacterium]
MNRNSLVAWVLLLGLMFVWTGYKQKQATAENRKKTEQHKADSLANLAKNPVPATAGDSAAIAAAAAKGTGTLGETAPNAGAPSAGAPAATALPAVAKTDSVPAVTRSVITVETNRFVVSLDNEGAKVQAISLKDLAGHQPLNPDIIPKDGGSLTLTVDNQDLSKKLWQTDADRTIKVSGAPVSVAFKLTTPDGKKTLVRTYTFFPDSNKFTHHLEASAPIGSYVLGWPSGLAETEKINHGKGVGLMNAYFSEVVFDNGVNVERTAFTGSKTFNGESGVLKWVGLRRKYVAALVNFNRETTNKVVATGKIPEGEEKTYPKEYDLQIYGNNVDEKTLDFDFLILPLSYDQLITYNQNYEKIIFSGWESFFRADVWYVGLCGVVLHLLKFFYGFVHNYGVAIILLTLLVRAITFPLTIAQTKQGVKMQQHMPAIAKIREKHKGQPQKANMEIMEYYKKEGVNPLSGVMGCFPVLLQMPIFISLFNVLGRSVELKGAPFMLWIHDLSLPDVVNSGFQVPYVFPLGLTILPFFMAATMYFQMKASIKDPNQKFMVWMMPCMMYIFSCSFPSGLVLYWTVSNLFTIAQTHFYTNRLKPAGAPVAATTGKQLPPRNKPART